MDEWPEKEEDTSFVEEAGREGYRAPPREPLLAEENGGRRSDEPEEAGESSSGETSDSGSSSSSSSGGSTTSTNSTATSNGLFHTDEFGEYLSVNCANNQGRMYLTRFARGSRGRCVLFRGRWITPNEFQAVSGRQSSKDWKRSIRLRGRCLKDYISQGLFKEHLKSCSCKICVGDPDVLKQEGEMALAAKRRRLSQADGGGGGGGGGSSTTSIPSSLEATPTSSHAPNASTPSGPSTSGVVGVEGGVAEGTSEGRLPGAGGVRKRKRGRPPKIQRVWSPSGEVAQEASSNEDDSKQADSSIELQDDSIIDSSDFLPRRSRRAVHRKHTGHRTELGTFTRKPRDWDTEEVAEFMRLQGFTALAERFQESDIDGQSLFMLKEQHLIDQFDLKLGPTLRLLDTISRLRHPPLTL